MGRRVWVRVRAATLGVVYILGLALGFTGLAGGLVSGTAAAASSDITNCTSAGSGAQSLTYAVANGGTWTFTCAGPGTYTLSLPATGLTVTNTLTLQVGSGVALTLDGGGTMQDPIFTIDNGGTLTLDGNNGNGQQDLTLTGGGSSTYGATVKNEGNLAFDHVAFTGNTSSYLQGPIVNEGTMTVSSSTFTNNTGDDGGAIDNGFPSYMMTSSTPTLTVSDSSFVGNSVFPEPPLADSGGAIYSAGALTVTRSTFTDNSATAVSTSSPFYVLPDQGGAIYVTVPFAGSSTAKITDSAFTGNHALDGGAIYAGAGNVSLAVYGSTFSGNLAYVADATSATVMSTAGLDLGGAVYTNASTFLLSNSTLAQNTAGSTVTRTVYGQGGALYIDSQTQTASVYNATLDGNAAYAAGDSLYVSSLSPVPTVTFANSILSDAAPTTSNCALPQPVGEPAPTLQGSHNLQYGDATCTSDATGWTDANPQLEPLGAYGGPTEGAPGSADAMAMQTEALGEGSPAIGAADATVCSQPPVGGVDERGQARPAAACDIGAYQTEVKRLTLTANPSSVLTNAQSTVGGAVYDEIGQGLPGQTVTLSLPPGSGSLAQTTLTTKAYGAFSTTYTAPASLPSPNPVTVTASVYSQVYGTLTATTTIKVQKLVPVLTSVTSTVTGVNSGPPDSDLQLLGQNFERPGTSPGSVSFVQGSTRATVPLTAATETDGTATVQLPSQFVAGAVYASVYNPALGVSTNSLPFTVLVTGGGGGGGGGGGSAPPTKPSPCQALTLPTAALTVSNASPTTPPGIAPDQKAASCVYTLSGPSLSQPRPVTIPYASSVLGGLPQSRLSVFRLRSNGMWTFLPTVVDGATQAVTADVSGPATLVVLADLQVFPDVPAGFWAKDAINLAAGAGLADGYPPPFRGLFDPQGTITRAQAVKMIVVDAQLLPQPGPTPFTDVRASDWFEPYVAAAYRAGILDGTKSTTFSPNASVTREAFAVMLARALKLSGTATLTFADTNQIAAWARSGVQAVVSAGYLVGEPGNLFDPLGPMTRADAAQAMARVVRDQLP